MNKNKNSESLRRERLVTMPTTESKRAEEEFTHCTFRPELISKSSKAIRHKENTTVFDDLYNDKKYREIQKLPNTKAKIKQ
jgi:hypothetical protein